MAGDLIPPAVIDVTGEDGSFLAMIAKDEGILAQWAKTTTNTQLGAESGSFQSTLATVKTELLDLAKQVTDAKLGADATQFWTEITALRTAVDAMSPLDINVDANISEALAEIAVLKGAAASAQAGLLADAAAARSAGGGGGDAGLLGLAGAGGGGGGGGGGLSSLLGLGGAGGLAGFGTLGSLMGFGLESMLTTALGVAGSAAGGLAGGAALGLGSAGVAGVGMGTDLAGLGQAAGDIKNVTTAQTALNQAIAEYGPLSLQAQQAQAQLNYTLSSFSPVAQGAVLQAANTAQGFKAMFDNVTGEAEKTGAQIITQLMQVGEKFLPTIGQYASQNMTIIQSSLQPLLTWIQGPGLSVFKELEQTFQNQLPTAMVAFDNGIELVIRVLGFLAPYTGRLIDDMAKWTTELNGADFSKLTGGINSVITIFRDWEGLIKAIGTAIYELFSHDAGTGTSLVVSLTNMINKFNDWARTVAGGDALHSLLESHKAEVLSIIGVLGHLISTWGQLELSARPVLMDLITLLGDVINFLFEIPGVGKIMGFVVAFEILGSRVGLLNGVLGSFNNMIKNLALDGLRLLGGALVSLGGPFTGIGTWLTGLGTEGTSEITTLTGAVERLNATLGETAVEGRTALAGVGAGAATGEAGLGVEEVGAGAGAAGAGAASLSAVLGPLTLTVGAVTLAAVGLGDVLHNNTNPAFVDSAQKAEQVNSSAASLSTKLATLTQAQGQAAAAMGEGGLGAAEASAIYNKLGGQIAAVKSQLGSYTSNLSELSTITGLATPYVSNLANALGINLTKALNPSIVEEFTNAIQQQGGVAGVMGSQWTAGAQQVQAAMEIMDAKAAQAMPFVSAATRNMIAQVQPNLITLVSDLQKTGDSAGAGFVSAYLANLSPAQLASKQMHDGVLSPLYPLETELQTLGQTGAAKMVASFIAEKAPAQSASQGIHDAITNPLASLAIQLQGDGYASAAAMVDAFLLKNPSAATAAGAMHDAITGKLNPLIQDLPSIGQSAATNIIATFIAQEGNAAAAGAGVGAALAAGVSKGLASNEAVQGVVAGATNLVTIGLAAAKNAAGVKSPSTLYAAELGVPLAQGIAVGMLAGATGVNSAAAALVRGAAGVRIPGSTGSGVAGSGLTVSPTYHVTINAPGGNAQQIGTSFKKVAQEHTDDLIRRLSAGTISSANG